MYSYKNSGADRQVILVYIYNKVLYALITIAVLCIAACKNNKASVKKAAKDSVIAVPKNLTISDSLQLVHDIDSADYDYLFANHTNTWIKKLLNDTALKWTDFSLVDFNQRNNLQEVNQVPGKELLRDYSIFLRLSPDSTYLLDFGSYGVTMTRDKSGRLFIQDGDVDSEIRLYNNITKTSRRLMFHGPSSNTWDAHWAGNQQVALLGTFDTSNNHHPDTLLWLINVKDNFFRQYKYRRR